MKKRLLALLMATTMVMSVTGCGNGSQAAGSGTVEADNNTTTESQTSADSDSAYITGKGTLVVGVTDFEPMDYKDENGNWVGFDADLATEFAKSLGVDVKFIEIEEYAESDDESIEDTADSEDETDNSEEATLVAISDIKVSL